MNYITTIGLEVHVQLKTKSKMFCSCATGFGAPPNSNVCPVCLGYPGAMPVMNEEAVHLTVLTGLMIGSQIPEYSKFDRKSYFYPDMPKNYQISQYDEPLCIGGAVEIDSDQGVKTVEITRIHLEEDVGKNSHFPRMSGVDFNRAGHPLMEVVTEPDISSPEDAYTFLQTLRRILLYLGVSYCNLEEGNMRCDVNCSVRPEGQSELGTKTEMKNLNSFKGVLNSLKYEIERQKDVLQTGGTIVQETRRWDVDAEVTASMRSKEDAHDYRYFPEPDLLPVILDSDLVSSWKSSLPELPRTRARRFVSDYELPEYDADVLTTDRAVADFFEAASETASSAKSISNWIMTEVMRVLTDKNVSIEDLEITPKSLSTLVDLVGTDKINRSAAKQVFEVLIDKGGDPDTIVQQKGLSQVSESGAIEAFVDEAIANNPKSVSDYKNGKTAAAKFLTGQVMRLSKGKANPRLVSELIKKKFSGSEIDN